MEHFESDVPEPDPLAAPETRALAARILEAQASQALMAAHLYGRGMVHAPHLGVMMNVVAPEVDEQLERFGAAEALHRAITGQGVRHRVEPRLARIRHPESWLELGVVHFLVEAAAIVHMEDYRSSAWAPLAELAAAIVSRCGERVGFGARVLLRMAERHDEQRPDAQRHIELWFPVALRSFGRPGSETSARAVAVGLKPSSPGKLVAEFVARLRPVMRETGIDFPARGPLEVVLPAGLDLSI